MANKNNSQTHELISHIKGITDGIEKLAAIVNSDAIPSFKLQIQLLSESPDTELNQVHQALREISGWNELPENMIDTIAKVEAGTQLTIEQQLTVPPPVPPPPQFPPQTECTLGNCPTSPTQEQVDNLLIAEASSDEAAAIATLAADTAAIFSERVGKVLQAIASGIDVVTKGIALAAAIIQRQVNLIAECESDAVNQLLLNMCKRINIIDSKVDWVIAKLVIMDQKLDVLLVLVKSIKKTVEQILLLKIEEALSECKKLISLLLPESAFGIVEKVQKIVDQLIAHAKLAHLETANAFSFWQQGSNALASGDYETALNWFMLAYQQLQTKNVCQVPCPTNPCQKDEKPCASRYDTK